MINYILKHMIKDFKKSSPDFKLIVLITLFFGGWIINSFILYYLFGINPGVCVTIGAICAVLDIIFLIFAMYIYGLRTKYLEKKKEEEVNAIQEGFRNGSEWKN